MLARRLLRLGVSRRGTSQGAPTAAMRDEYDRMDSTGLTHTVRDFRLESGVVLPEARVCYNTFGQLNERRDNLIVVCHALTGNSRLDQWWGTILGPGKALDTSKYMVMCANVLGSCYGTTGPASVNPLTGELYGIDFPEVSRRRPYRHLIRSAGHDPRHRPPACGAGEECAGRQQG